MAAGCDSKGFLQPTCSRLQTDRRTVGGITQTKAAALQKFCTTIAIARKPQANDNSYNAIVLYVCHERPPQKTNNPQCPSPPWRRFCESAIADKVMRNDTSGPSKAAAGRFDCC